MAMTKATLKADLLGHEPARPVQGNTSKAMRRMEKKLTPWVVANPSVFPELLDEAFIFTYMLPVGLNSVIIVATKLTQIHPVHHVRTRYRMRSTHICGEIQRLGSQDTNTQ